GLDANRLLDRADEMAVSCSACLPAEQNPGVVLGAILGVLANRKRDKLTIAASPAIFDLGAWLEQLVAESTGKDGKAIIPVDREALGPPVAYGADRLFAYLRFSPEPDAAQDAAIEVLEKAGQPVIRISIDDRYDLGQEFFRWEIATAVAGAIMKINPFNQPDVEESKIETRKLTTEYEHTGALPPESPFLEERGLALYTDKANAAALGNGSAGAVLKAHLARLQTGDYFALLAYIEMNEAHERALQAMRMAVRDAKKVATCLGFGPRFLHSTGQAYKGGSNNGVFLQITCDDKNDLAIPGAKYTFGVVKAAQARGDFQVLAQRGRRALRVHLRDVGQGLQALGGAVAEALR
ncbi:MAG: bifunctional transaldolase/phosoglucose isomerase, partial [Bryobacteraceae bacterium]